MHPEDSPYQLKTSDEGFLERNKNVFDQLNKLSCNLSKNEMEVDEQPPERKRDSMRQFRGKESIFKRPHEPLRKSYFKKMPDFKVNPHKWTRYSLADVKEEDLSDKNNTRAALSFLNELKSRQGTKDEQEDAPGGKIVFKKVRKDKEIGEGEEKASFSRSKVVMPEYVVGKSAQKTKKKKESSSKGSSLELKLDHLYEDE